MVWVTVLCGLFWWAAGPERTAASHLVHRHLLLVFIPLMLVPTVLASKLLAWLLVSRLSDQRRSTFRDQLRQTELFQSPNYPEISFLNLVRGLFSVPLYHLLSLLWLPSLLLLSVFQPGAPVYIQLLRDGLYRACEAYTNGIIDGREYKRIIARYDETMITMLAIDGLTSQYVVTSALMPSAKATKTEDGLESESGVVTQGGGGETGAAQTRLSESKPNPKS